jgi:thymidylate synthase
MKILTTSFYQKDLDMRIRTSSNAWTGKDGSADNQEMDFMKSNKWFEKVTEKVIELNAVAKTIKEIIERKSSEKKDQASQRGFPGKRKSTC